MKKKNKLSDPYYAREAKKYSEPIVSREYIMQYLQDIDKLVTFTSLLQAFVIKPEQTKALQFRLQAMVRDGQLMRDRKGRYGLVNKLELIAGRIQGHPDGFGFVIPDGGGEDLFLSAGQMRNVLHGDRVLVHCVGRDKRGRPEGTIVEVLERAAKDVVGRLFFEQGIYFIEPDNKRMSQSIMIPVDKLADAKPGQIVVVEIQAYPSKRSPALGVVREILGEHRAPGMEIDIAIRSHEIPVQWPQQVLVQTKQLSDEVQAADRQGRADLRKLNFVTIDGADARDFDDAVYCEARPKGGWKLFVAIADVSYYVRPNSALDNEAILRGTSVYFPGSVIPMLPEKLSNGLCSLNPLVDRLVLVCEMTLSTQASVQQYRFYPAVIHSKARLTYAEVAAMLVDNDTALRRQYAALYSSLEILYSLYKVLHENRRQRGAIEFEIPETRILFAKDKKIEKIIPVMRNDAHRLIEECMLLANVCAARFVLKYEVPALFRVHDKPPTEKIMQVREFLAELGLQLKGGKSPQPIHYVHLLESVAARPDRQMIQTILLMSMSQAVYSPHNIGHFGLAYKTYTHFTSPIRRYPDLLTHRAIHHILARQEKQDFLYSPSEMEVLGERCSTAERRADEATRDAISWLKCEYMLDKVGEEFAGIVSGVTNFGLFVTLQDIYIDGLVHVTSLHNEYYHFEAAKHRLIGERSHKVYRLGDTLRVLVARVDLDDRKIDLELA